MTFYLEDERDFEMKIIYQHTTAKKNPRNKNFYHLKKKQKNKNGANQNTTYLCNPPCFSARANCVLAKHHHQAFPCRVNALMFCFFNTHMEKGYDK